MLRNTETVPAVQVKKENVPYHQQTARDMYMDYAPALLTQVPSSIPYFCVSVSLQPVRVYGCIGGYAARAKMSISRRCPLRPFDAVDGFKAMKGYYSCTLLALMALRCESLVVRGVQLERI